MLETLHQIDVALFYFINMTIANPVTDWIMPYITSGTFLKSIYGVAMLLLLWRGSPRLRWLVLFSALVLTLTDQTASHLLKPLFGRLRPCHVLENINLLVGCGGGKAMPSSHAANAMGQAFLFSLAAKETRWYLYAFAGLVAVSRTFVGVHYPFDVIVGSAVGAFWGIVVWQGFKGFRRWVDRRKERRNAIRD